MSSGFKSLVREAVADELGKVAMYARMANVVRATTIKTLILGVAGDEHAHARTWMALLALSD